MWKFFSYGRLIKEFYIPRILLEKTNIGRLSATVTNNRFGDRNAIMIVKMCCLYVILVLPGSVKIQLGWSGKFCSRSLVYRAFLPVSTGTKSIKIDREKQELQSKTKWHVFMAHGVLDKYDVGRVVDHLFYGLDLVGSVGWVGSKKLDAWPTLCQMRKTCLLAICNQTKTSSFQSRCISS